MKKYIQPYGVVGMALLSIVYRFAATIIALCYEKAGERGEYVSYSYIRDFEGYLTMGFVAFIAYIFLSGMRMKKTVRNIREIAGDREPTEQIPWRRIFFAYWGSGELLNFLICCIPVGLTTFGLYTASIVYFLYVRIYGFSMGRVSDLLSRTPFYIGQDFLAFIPFYLIYAMILLAIQYMIFMWCCHQEKKIWHSTVSKYDSFVYTVRSITVRVVSYVLIYFISIRDGSNDFMGICTALALLIFFIWNLRERKKNFSTLQTNDQKADVKAYLCRVIPCEIFVLLISFALFFYFDTFHFGKLLLYPVYALFHVIYLANGNRLEAFSAGEYHFMDHVVFLLCWILVMTACYVILYMVSTRMKIARKKSNT